MARRRSGGGSKPSARKDNEPLWLEWLEQRPVGRIGFGVVLAGWLVLLVLFWRKVWTLEVTFFVVVAWLTFVLGWILVYSALVQARGTKPNEALRLPESWRDLENYFRWLTPVAFMFGVIFAHYFWH